MSIFKKVVILFSISLMLMLIVGREIDLLINEKIELILKEKYLQNSKELFKNLSNANYEMLRENLKEFGFKEIENIKHHLEDSNIIYLYKSDFASIKIFKHDDRYFLYMKYLDEEILAVDLSQDSDILKKRFLNILVIMDIFILIVIFFIIIKFLMPLKSISKELKSFENGNYDSRVKIKTNDEVGNLGERFNSMAKNLESLIYARETLLRDISHELKTPISKAKLAVEMVEDSKYKSLIKKALAELDSLTSELLSLERLNANSNLNFDSFGSERLIIESLDKLFIEDENVIDLQIEDNFLINGDIAYLSIALKNLIDNALKYSSSYPIIILSKDRKIIIKSRGEELKKEFKFYLQEFNRESLIRGDGLGLNIVKKILDRHSFNLNYSHKNGFNSFAINF